MLVIHDSSHIFAGHHLRSHSACRSSTGIFHGSAEERRVATARLEIARRRLRTARLAALWARHQMRTEALRSGKYL
jgi:hypothetical protein